MQQVRPSGIEKRSFIQVNQPFIILSAQSIHEFFNECRTQINLPSLMIKRKGNRGNQSHFSNKIMDFL